VIVIGRETGGEILDYECSRVEGVTVTRVQMLRGEKRYEPEMMET
jgi:hypothetical protein